MPNFKPKAKKKFKINKKSTMTLDSKHNEKMKLFENIKDIQIPDLIAKKKELTKSLQLINNIEDILNVKDEIKEITSKIKKLKKQKKDYLLENSGVIFEYFEKKKEVSLGKSNNKNDLLHSFFNKDKNVVLKNKNEDTTVSKFLTNLNENFIDMNKFTIDYEKCENCGGEWITI